MGSFPKLKRRFFCPSSVLLATVLSVLIVYMFLSAQPAYLERLPDVLSPPSHEKEAGEVGGGFRQKEESDAKVDEPAQKVAQETPETITTPPVTTEPVSQKNQGWKFDPARDASNYALSSEQCNSAFPGLFGEVERGVAAQQQIGNITEEQLDISGRDNGALHGMILDQQVCFAVPLSVPPTLL